MKAFTVAALFGAAVLAAPNPDKTVYQTEEVTITSCGPEVTNCPASSHATPAVSTPVGSVPASSGVEGVTSAPTPTPEYSTSTVYSTLISSGSEGVVTQTVAISTTICPVTATETPGVPVASGPAGTPGAPPAAGTPSAGAPPAAGTPVVPVSSGVEGGSGPSPSAPAGGSSTNTCEPIYSTSTIYITPGVSSAPAGTGYVPYPTGGPYASSAVAGTPGVPVAPTTPASTPQATPPSYTGAANAMNAAGAVAGFGAIAAFFL
ncbi:hypothetical protein SLS56_003740 [Neofusicoccum ribis]|uniref:GPI anchored serine-rich protein n=1 Tax=Neofusicoccum ribis TaxID=45134 RepID=A0ABR3SYC2_9PEZI